MPSETNTVKPGYLCSEFWLHMVAVILPVLAQVLTPVLTATANPVAISAAALLAALAGNYGAGKYSEARAYVKATAAPVAK